MKSSPFSPRHWPMWLVAGILWLLIQLPYSIQLKIGKFLGLLAYYIAKRERKIGETNITLCFPKLSHKEREKLLRENFISAGQATLETLFGWWANPKRLEKLVHIKGLSHVKKALKHNKGVLVFAPHMTCIHMVGRLVNLKHPFAVMYFPPKNPVFRYISERALPKCYQMAIPRDNAKHLIRALKKNTAVLYTPDVDAGPKGLFVPFFGISASTVTATSRFSQLTDCPVIPATCHRRKDGKGFNIEFLAPLTHFPTHDIHADTQRVNMMLEKFIEKYPAQYLWQYKRFKTRPDGERKYYE